LQTILDTITAIVRPLLTRIFNRGSAIRYIPAEQRFAIRPAEEHRSTFSLFSLAGASPLLVEALTVMSPAVPLAADYTSKHFAFIPKKKKANYKNLEHYNPSSSREKRDRAGITVDIEKVIEERAKEVRFPSESGGWRERRSLNSFAQVHERLDSTPDSNFFNNLAQHAWDPEADVKSLQPVMDEDVEALHNYDIDILIRTLFSLKAWTSGRRRQGRGRTSRLVMDASSSSYTLAKRSSTPKRANPPHRDALRSADTGLGVHQLGRHPVRPPSVCSAFMMSC
jgi:hypothetical protein